MSIVFIGIIRYKEIYYDTATEQFRVYITDVLSGNRTEVERKKKLMDFAIKGVPLAAPLVVLLLNRVVGYMPEVIVHERLPAVLHILLSAVIGVTPAIVIGRKVRSIWERHYKSAPAASAEEIDEAVMKLKSENRLYTVFQLILILGIIGVPILNYGSKTLFPLIGYPFFWLMLFIMLTVFRICDRWIAEWQLHNRRVNGKGQ